MTEGTGSEALRTWRRYDAAGRVHYEITDLDGDNVAPNPGSQTIDTGDRVVEHSYTQAGRQHQIIRPPADVTSFDWFNSATNGDKRVTTYTYDDAGRVETLVTPGGTTGLTTSYQYDGDNRVTHELSPGSYETVTSYDAAGLPLTVTTPSPTGTGTVTVTRTYTYRGELSTQTAPYPTGQTPPNPTRFGYWRNGNLRWVDDARGSGATDSPTRVDYGYDARGNRTSRSYTTVPGPGGAFQERLEAWAYNGDNQEVSHSRPTTGAVTTSYDNHGRPGVRAWPSGRTRTSMYWSSGRVKEEAFAQPGQTSVVVDRAYDSHGRRTTMVDTVGSVSQSHTLGYDRAGNVTGFEQANPANVNDPLTFAASFDMEGRRRTLTYEDGAQFRYSHNRQGLLSAADVWLDGSQSWFPAAAYTYDADGDQTATVVAGTFGNRSWVYPANHARQPVSYTQDMAPLNGSTVADRVTSLGWWPDGRVHTETTGSETRTYSYDPAGQLAGRDSSSGPDFVYYNGPVGERVVSSAGSTGSSFSYDSADRLVGVDSTGTSNDMAYTYDADGRRLTATRGVSPSTPVTSSSSYDPRGLLAQTSRPGGPTIARGYNGDGVLTLLGVGGASSNLAWDPAARVPQLLEGDVDGDTWTRLAYGNERIAFQFFDNNSQVAFGHYPYDVFGSVIPNGESVVTSADYDPFGVPTTDIAATYGQHVWFGYRGELHIDGLVHLRNRDYDPTIGAFTTPDLWDGVDGTPTVADVYRYGYNDPVNRIDPLGFRPDDCGTWGASWLGLDRLSNWSCRNQDQLLDLLQTIGALAVGGLCELPFLGGSAGFGAAVGAGGAGGACAGVVDRALNNIRAGRPPFDGVLDPNQVAQDAIVGGITGGLVYGALGRLGRGVGDDILRGPGDDILRGGDDALDGTGDDLLDGFGDDIGDDVAAACRRSFAAATPVLMADGTTKAIHEVDVGEYVFATDPETGRSRPREVTATLPHTDQMFALGTSAGEVVTTEDHRFWNATEGEWQESQDLDTGDLLLTPDGDEVQVVGLDRSTAHSADAYDLDVAELDSFYVGVGEENVLVHNQDDLEHTPLTHPDEFEPVRGSSARRHEATGEIWELDRLHRDHYEVYKNKKQWENGNRTRDVWSDGRPKGCF